MYGNMDESGGRGAGEISLMRKTDTVRSHL